MNEAAPKKTRATVSGEDMRALVDCYIACYTRAYGIKPIFNGVSGRACKLMLQAMPVREAVATMENAFADQYFVDRMRGNLMSLWGKVNEYRKVLPPERIAAKPVEAPVDAVTGVEMDPELKTKLGL